MSLDSQVALKKQELEALKKITELTDTMKSQLDGMANQVEHMESNAETVSKVLENWDSITRSISQAGLSLLQYTEGDYEVGIWKSNNKNEDESDKKNDQEIPLPETLVRIRVDDQEKSSK